MQGALARAAASPGNGACLPPPAPRPPPLSQARRATRLAAAGTVQPSEQAAAAAGSSSSSSGDRPAATDGAHTDEPAQQPTLRASLSVGKMWQRRGPPPGAAAAATPAAHELHAGRQEAHWQQRSEHHQQREWRRPQPPQQDHWQQHGRESGERQQLGYRQRQAHERRRREAEAAAAAAEEVDEGRARELNALICGTTSATKLLRLLEGRLEELTLVNAVTAFHRLAKHARTLPSSERMAVRRHPAVFRLAARLETSTGRLVDLQLAQLLWAHAQLKHGSFKLVKRLLGRLAKAVVVGPQQPEAEEAKRDSGEAVAAEENGAAPDGSGEQHGAQREAQQAQHGGQQVQQRRQQLRIERLDAAVMLAYSLAKLQHPIPAFTSQLSAVLLAGPGGREEEEVGGEEQVVHVGGARQARAQGRQAASAASERGEAGGSGDLDEVLESLGAEGQEEEEGEGGGEGGSGSRAGEQTGARVPTPVSLARGNSPSLALLLWSLATLGTLRPDLLRRSTRVMRRRGLHTAELRSLILTVSAQAIASSGGAEEPEAAAAAAEAAFGGGGEEGGQGGGRASDANGSSSGTAGHASGTAAPGGTASVGCWDLDFVDAVAAELAQRRAEKRQGFWLNRFDVCILAHGFALAWQAALRSAPPAASAGSGEDGASLPGSAGGGGMGDNRVALRSALQRHISDCPDRKAAVKLLVGAAQHHMPRLNTKNITSLAWSFASLLPHKPASSLLDSLAARAIELGSSGRLDAQAAASLAWSFSTLQFDHPQLYDCLAASVLRMLGSPPGATAATASDTAAEAGTAAAAENGSGRREAGGGSAAGTSAERSSSSSGSGGAGRAAPGSAVRGSFGAQTVSLLVFSFASANRCSSPTQQKMMAALAERAGEVLPEFTTQGLANLAWGLAVAGVYPPLLISRWRAAAGAAQRRFKPAEKNQLHLVEVALRLEAPPALGPLPAESASFFDSLYQAGRVRAFAGRAWVRHQEAGERSVSDFQMQVHRAVCALGVPCQLEHCGAGEYSIDIAIPDQRIAIEADGPVHFACNTHHPLGSTALKRRLLERLGWRVVAVPFFEWRNLDESRQQAYMKGALQKAGLAPPGEPSGRQQQEREEAAEKERQRQQQLAAAAADESREGEQAEESASPAAVGGEDSAAQAASLAQRAQRLSLLQYKQGKLSRQGLVARTGLQAAAAGGGGAGRAEAEGAGAGSGEDKSGV